MKRIVVVGGLAISALLIVAPLSAANAADMAVKAPLQAPAPVYSWTGFYVGVEGGGGWAKTQHTNSGNGINSGTTDISGGLLGGTYGYNQQFGSWVIGVEGDFSWSGLKKFFNDNNGTGFCSPNPAQCETDLRWFGTDRARLGYAWDRYLVYGTAGVAYGDVMGNLTNAAGLGQATPRVPGSYLVVVSNGRSTAVGR